MSAFYGPRCWDPENPSGDNPDDPADDRRSLGAVARRAGALCAVAEPHRHDLEDWPCDNHLAEAARQLRSAPASTVATGGPASIGAAVDGVAGPLDPSPARPATPTPDANQPRTTNPGLAEGGPARPQNEGTR